MITKLNQRKQLAAKQKQCDWWNAANPVGTDVILKQDFVGDTPTKTRSHAFLASSKDPVIFLEGISGYYLLSYIRLP